MSGVVTDNAVPEGHRDLHAFLYGDGGAEAHDASTVYTIRQGEDDGSSIVGLSPYIEARNLQKPLGVYAVYNNEQQPQYIGYSRNVVLALKAHVARLGEEKCAFVRVMVFANKAMATRDNMQREVDHWVEEAGAVPPGNAGGPESQLWSQPRQSEAEVTAAMSPDELAEYEEKKLRLRKAMGENMYDDVEGEGEDGKQRRLNFLQAVEGDDWSGVIDGQTQATMSDAEAGVVSPFSRSDVSAQLAQAEQLPPLELTVANVDMVLDDVRPYLIADGGNVEVVGVELGVVALRLQGACGTCPSSTATMKGGIEKALEKRFGDTLKQVVQVDQIDISASPMSVNSHLDVLRPAITNYGGKVDCLSVKDGVCDVMYTGPAPLSVGITAAIKDKFPDIKEVVMHP